MKLKKNIFLFTALFLLTSFMPVSAGGSSFSITEINPGPKVFQPGQKDQVLFKFTVNPTYVGGLKLKHFELSCKPDAVFESVRLIQADKQFESILSTEKLLTQTFSFTQSETIPKNTETLFQVKVDVKEAIDNTIIFCRATAFEFEEIATGAIKKMPEQSSGGLSDDYYLIYIEAEDSIDINDKVSITQPGVTWDFPLGQIAKGANIAIEAGDQDIKVQGLYAVCDNQMAEEFKLMNMNGEYSALPHDIGLKYAQAVVFPVVNVTIPAHKRSVFTLELHLTSSHLTPYYKKNKCAFTGITFSGEEFKKARYQGLKGFGLENSDSAFRVYDPRNLTDFSDVPETHPHYEAIKFLRQFDIVDGYEDGTFKPELEVKRSELAKLLYQASWSSVGETWDANTPVSNCFKDVTDEWFSEYVCPLKSKNWVSGHPDGNFRPQLSVNYVEALKMIFLSQRIAVLSEKGWDHWYVPYLVKSGEMGVDLSEVQEFDQPLTRGQVSQLLYETLKWLDQN